MTLRTKNIIYSVVLVVAVFAVWLYRKNQTPEPIRIEGKTMGTSYHITYFDDQQRDLTASVDSLLAVVNKSINNYDPSSEVSRFNDSQRGVAFDLPYLYSPLVTAKEVFEISGGAFDPTVMPLVNAWGFGPAEAYNPDSAKVDSLRSIVGFEKVSMTNDSLTKTDPRVQLDFGGIGQGYGADVIADFMRARNITDMLIEIGGEGMAIGTNLRNGKRWEIGILDPQSTLENQFFKAYIALENQSFTTSGNYFNYHIVDGKRYSHTMDPASGYPAQREILSASVFAIDATTADVWGTAFMAMGHEKAIELLKQHPELDAILMYSGNEGAIETYVTPGITAFVKLVP
jgi:thiamine biosynthesis lipoprotein